MKFVFGLVKTVQNVVCSMEEKIGNDVYIFLLNTSIWTEIAFRFINFGHLAEMWQFSKVHMSAKWGKNQTKKVPLFYQTVRKVPLYFYY